MSESDLNTQENPVPVTAIDESKIKRVTQELAQDELDFVPPEEHELINPPTSNNISALDGVEEAISSIDDDAIEALCDIAVDDDGAVFIAQNFADIYEDCMQTYGHKDFVLPQARKDKLISTLPPVVKKRAPAIIKAAGGYADLILVAVTLGNMAVSSYKDIIALKAADAKANAAAKVSEDAQEVAVKEAA